MKQRVGGLFLGLVCACVASCGGGDAGTTENPGTSATVGMSSPAGSPATGAKAGTSGGAGTGTATSPVTGAAGVKAAAGGGAAGMTASAGAGAAGMIAGAAGAAGTSTAAVGGGAAGAAGMTAGAAGGSAAGGCGTESFKAIYDSILKNTTYNCAGVTCHGREGAMAMTVGGLSLSSAAVAYMQLVKVASTGTACMGKTRVVPGDAMGSLLVQKLRGGTVLCGAAMPVGGDEINDTDLKRITDWISAGACDN